MVAYGPGTRCARQRTLANDGFRRRIFGLVSCNPVNVDRWIDDSFYEFFEQRSIDLNFTCSQGSDELWQAG